MKSISSVFIALLFLVQGLMAADKPLSAFQTLDKAKKQLGDSKIGLLQMETKYSKLQPRYWWIRFYDPSLFLKVRAVHMIGPEMIRNIEPGNPFDGGDEAYVIPRDSLKYDSDYCIKFMEKAAKENHIPLHSLNITLEKPHEGETNPVWTFEWLDENEGNLGTLKVSASTGRITEVVGLKIKARNIGGVSKTKFSEDVEETFLGIGGDLEEFFTGKRSVDRDDPVKNGDRDK